MAGLGKACGCGTSTMRQRCDSLHFITRCIRAFTHVDKAHELLSFSSVLSDVHVVTCLEDLPVITSVGGTREHSL